MRLLRILIVDDEDDELGWPKTFSKNIRTIPLTDLVGNGYGDLEIEHVTNQADADKAIADSGPQGYDLILLDLRYPLTSGGWVTGYQGMKWLPDLRRLQPNATIVIVTGFAEDEHLKNAVAAIRDFHANDFIPKTESFGNIVARIRVAWGNALNFQHLVMFEEEFHNLIRTRAIRAYAEDVGVLLSQTKTSLFNVARRLESGDPSELAAAADLIRSQFSRLRKEFDELTGLLNEGEDRLREVDVSALIQQMLKLYRRVIVGAQAAVIKPDEDQRVLVNTYEGDLKVALYELITNAIDSLKNSDTFPEDRLLEIAIEKVSENVIVRVADNGDGFSDEALERMYERGFTTNRDGKHQGLGLYIARRMMHHIGGNIRAANKKEGGAEVMLTFRDLRLP